MSPLASSWLESGTFWTVAVGAAASILSAAFGAWMANRYNNPKHRLEFQWYKNTSLLEAASGSGALTVQHGGTALTEPRVIDVSIRNNGKKEITASTFHANQPIEISLDSKIIEVKDIQNEPPTSTPPNWSISPGGDKLLISPSLLVAKQQFKISVVADGPGDESKFRFIAPLIGIEPEQVLRYDHEKSTQRTKKLMNTALCLCAGTMVMAAIGLAIVSNQSQDLLRDYDRVFDNRQDLSVCYQAENAKVGVDAKIKARCEKAVRDSGIVVKYARETPRVPSPKQSRKP